MDRFQHTGGYEFHGNLRELFVIRNNSPHAVKAVIKVLPHLDGIVFSGCFELQNESAQHFILDGNGHVSQYSSALRPFIGRDGILPNYKEIRTKLSHKPK